MEITDQAGNPWHKEMAQKARLNIGVKCAHVCIHFQCQGCWIRNLEGRDIIDNDQLYIKCICRANLNAMAGKSHLTIGGHRREIVANIKRCELIGKTPSFKPRGPFPQEDQVGMGVMVDMLLKSLMAKGKIQKWVQFDTLRHIRSTYSKVYQLSPTGVYEAASFAQGTGRISPTACPTQSEWMLDALRCMEMMMGFDS